MAIFRADSGIWLIEGDTHRTKWVLDKGHLNIDALIDEICGSISPGDWVIDVGANIGDHTYFYERAVGTTGRVYAFEPDVEAFACLQLNCGFSDYYCQAGLYSRRASVRFLPADNRGQSRVMKEDEPENVKEVIVELFPLDDLKIERCDLIKIDVEGVEMDVLQGARKTIEQNQPVIVIELIESQLNRYNSSKDEVLYFLRNMGYNSIVSLRRTERVEDDRVDVICHAGNFA